MSATPVSPERSQPAPPPAEPAEGPLRIEPAGEAHPQSADWIDRTSSWLSSLLLHATVLLLLTLFSVRQSQESSIELELVLNLEAYELSEEELLPISGSWESDSLAAPVPGLDETPLDVPTVAPAVPPATGAEQPRDGAGMAVIDDSRDWLAAVGVPRGGRLEGRLPGRRGELLAARGGTRESEEAVERGLRWLAAHQRDDGGWRFNHHDGPCNGLCRDPGNHPSTTAATGLALLAFYGAGHTHHEGEYRRTVGRGLYYLGSRMRVHRHGGDLQEGTMYAQGIAAILLCEAYAMSGDENLREFAQAAIDYIAWAQHPAGGWRYRPGQPGDLTSTAWQFMAIRSGQMAHLDVSSDTVFRVADFLDTLASDGGAQYGYQTPRSQPSTTAIGLLCRMYLGWRHDHEALRRGVRLLDDWGPSPDDMYYNYYATQVMSHYGGPLWERWNERMREQLIRDQARTGHEAGSWHYDHQHAVGGGRLYNTCMAILTLEVYYRYLPIYGEEATRW